MTFLIEQTAQYDLYEGAHFQFKVIHSNRHGDSIEITSLYLEDHAFRVPAQRVQGTLDRLEKGEDPDLVAKSFPFG